MHFTFLYTTVINARFHVIFPCRLSRLLNEKLSHFLLNLNQWPYNLLSRRSSSAANFSLVYHESLC